MSMLKYSGGYKNILLQILVIGIEYNVNYYVSRMM